MQFSDGRSGQQLGACEQGQHIQERGILQPLIAAAAHQLHGLHDEFQFADSARAELQVLIEFLPRDFTGNECLHLPQGIEHAEVEIASIDKGPDEISRCRRVGRRADDGTCFDPSISFPITPMLLQIILE